MKLSELCSRLQAHRTYDFVENEVTGIAHDSRKIKKGYIFVAINGHKLDGHDYVVDAMEKEAVALIVERKSDVIKNIPQIVVSNTRQAMAFICNHFYGNPSSQMTVIGVTGTNGKTTTTFLTKSIIEANGCKTGLIGTIQYQIGNRIIPARETTPESVEIQSFLSEMLKSKIKYAVIEASSHALSQHRLDGTCFRSAIFTNLSAEHLDYHENIRSYREEKLKLVKGLDSKAFAILNADHNTSKLFAACTKSQVLWYSLKKKKKADVTAEILQADTNKTKFLLNTPWGKETIFLKLIGNHNVYNALAAATNALALGFKIETVKTGIESLETVQGRLEKIDYGQDFQIYIDFAHTHQALQIILGTLRDIAVGRILLVFGCGGDRDKKKRPKMGHIAEKYSDLFWITSDNPRSEDPYSIISDIQKGIKKHSSSRVQVDRKIAIKEALLEAKKGDIVIIAGKGHEQQQIFKDTIVPFDDREVVRRVLQTNLLLQS